MGPEFIARDARLADKIVSQVRCELESPQTAPPKIVLAHPSNSVMIIEARANR